MAVFLAVGSAVAGIVAHREMAELTHRAAMLRGQAVLGALAVPAANAIATQDLVRLDTFVAELERAERGELLLLLVLDQQGKLLATSHTGFMGTKTDAFGSEFTAHALAAEGMWFEFGPNARGPEWLDVALPIRQGQRWGTLVARFSLESLRAQQSSLTRLILALSVVAGLLGWIIATALLDRFVLRPTQELSQMAEAIGRNEFSVRTNIEHRKDEIGALGESLNQMAAQLRKYTGSLEDAVRERTRELEEANHKLELLATTDALTGLRNIRFFQETLEFEVRRAERHPRRFALCMLDLDHFKSYNDTHGHPSGDTLLRQFAEILRQNTRAIDVVARYGGEEFVVLLLDADEDAAMLTAEKLVRVVREHAFDNEDTQPLGRVTVSAGLACFPADADSAAALIERADRALYAAKGRGRDRAMAFSDDLLNQPSFSPSDRFETMDIIERGRK